jgi:hypothetical protein
MWRTQADFLMHADMGIEEIVRELKCRVAFNLLLVGFETTGPASASGVRVEPGRHRFGR